MRLLSENFGVASNPWVRKGGGEWNSNSISVIMVLFGFQIIAENSGESPEAIVAPYLISRVNEHTFRCQVQMCQVY